MVNSSLSVMSFFPLPHGWLINNKRKEICSQRGACVGGMKKCWGKVFSSTSYHKTLVHIKNTAKTVARCFRFIKMTLKIKLENGFRCSGRVKKVSFIAKVLSINKSSKEK